MGGKLLAGMCMVVLLGGCATSLNDSAREDLARKASYEMECPEEKLEMTVLKKMFNGRETQIGVEGCGQKATYIISERGDWIQEKNWGDKKR